MVVEVAGVWGGDRATALLLVLNIKHAPQSAEVHLLITREIASSAASAAVSSLPIDDGGTTEASTGALASPGSRLIHSV